MTNALDIMALLLPADDREAVLGDLEEQKKSSWLRFFAVLNFVLRQQADFSRNYYSWVIGGIVIPATLLLLGDSFRLSSDLRDFLHGTYFGEPLLYQAALIVAWAGTGGFVLGAFSRRTGWIAPLLFTVPCISCLMSFREPSLTSACLLIFVPPGLVGTVFGVRWMRLGLVPSMILMGATLIVMLLWHGMPARNWLLLFPALHLAWAALKQTQLEQRRLS